MIRDWILSGKMEKKEKEKSSSKKSATRAKSRNDNKVKQKIGRTGGCGKEKPMSDR